jgi:Cytochrome c.
MTRRFTCWGKRVLFIAAATTFALPYGSLALAQAKGKKATGAKAQAAEIYKTRCASCHGPDGRGDGPAAAALNPKPRNFHDQKWQASVTDKQIEKVIVDGGAAIGKSPLMTANPDLKSKPEVVSALRQYIRDLGKKK